MIITDIPELDSELGGLPSGKVTTMIFDDVYLKNTIISNIVSSSLKSSGLTIYVDMDTIFSAYLDQGIVKMNNNENLILFTPEGYELDETFAKIFSIELSEEDIIVIDSVTAFYHIQDDGVSFSTLNKKMGLYIFLLKDLVSKSGATVIILSMMRSKQIRNEGSMKWFYSPSGGRVLEKASDIILSILKDEKICAMVMKHSNKEFIHRRIYFK